MSEQSGPGETVWYSPQQLEEIVRAFMEKERDSHNIEITQLRQQVDAMAKSMAGSVPTLIPEHGAGVGTAVHPTWSKYEQEMQNAVREAAALAAMAQKAAPVVLPVIEGL